MTRIGMCYVTGPADRQYDATDPSFNVHRVVSDESEYPLCVTVENEAGQRFPVATVLIDQIASVSPI